MPKTAPEVMYDRCEAIFALSREGRSSSEIASILNIPLGTVLSRRHIGRTRFNMQGPSRRELYQLKKPKD